MGRGFFMGKFKDKLYRVLVESNYNICTEYQNYVNTHLHEHKRNRIKSWWILIGLNFHYRIFKKKNPMLALPTTKEIPTTPVIKVSSTPQTKTAAKLSPAPEKPDVKGAKLPYLDGSESEGLKRRKSFYLVKELMNYDVVSFDIFDTLILRPFNNPTDLFMVVGEKLSIMNFRAIRIAAEKQAREEHNIKFGNHEITIYDIYKFVSRRTGLDIDKGVEAEFNIEKEFCFANPYMMQVFKMLKEQGKEIIITSDMYLPHDMMEELLQNCGYNGYSKLYVSCDYHCNKRNGGLYHNVIRDYRGKKIIHIGDNYTTDIEKAKELGIAASYYKSCRDIGNIYRADGMSELVGSLYAGIVNTHLHNGSKTYDPYYEYGFIYGGLYVLGYCNWIYNKAKSENVEKILFLARDGDIYQKVFNMMFDDMPNEYVYWSRIANLKYTAENCRDDFLTRIARYKALNAIKCTAEEALEGMDLGWLIPKLSKYHLKKDMLLLPETEKYFEDFLIDVWDDIVEFYDRESRAVNQWFCKIIGNAKKIAVVDVGWVGSGPLGIKYLVEKKWNMDCEVKCYVAACRDTDPSQNANELMAGNIESYIFTRMHNRNLYDTHSRTNKGTNNVIFEMFTQACSPTFSGYGNDGSFHFNVPEAQNYLIINKIQKGILDFSKIYFRFSKNNKLLLNISGYDAYLPYRMVIRNLKLVKILFGNMSYSRGVGISAQEQQIEKISDIFKALKMS